MFSFSRQHPFQRTTVRLCRLILYITNSIFAWSAANLILLFESIPVKFTHPQIKNADFFPFFSTKSQNIFPFISITLSSLLRNEIYIMLIIISFYKELSTLSTQFSTSVFSLYFSFFNLNIHLFTYLVIQFSLFLIYRF